MGECQQSRMGAPAKDPFLPEDQRDLVAEGVKAGWRYDTSRWLMAEAQAKPRGGTNPTHNWQGLGQTRLG